MNNNNDNIKNSTYKVKKNHTKMNVIMVINKNIYKKINGMMKIKPKSCWKFIGLLYYYLLMHEELYSVLKTCITRNAMYCPVK